MDGPGRLAALPTGRGVRSLIILIWLVVAAVSVPLGGKLTNAEKNDSSAFLPGSAESTQVIALQEKFPGGQTLAAVIVFSRDTKITEADRTRVTGLRSRLRTLAAPGTAVSEPAVSTDGKAVLLSVPLPQTASAQVYSDQIKTLRQAAAGAALGMKVQVTGPAGYIADSFDLLGNINSTLLLATAGVVALILLVVYRSPILWLVPLVVVGIADQTATAVVYLLARHAGLTVNAQSAGILRVLVFGAGTDYALLLIARYREELTHHRRASTAMAVSLRQAGPAIVASAVTVVLSLLVLLVSELNSDKGLGPVGAAGILCGFAAMITLLPALLVACGRGLFWPFVPRYGVPHDAGDGVWGRIAAGIRRRPRAVAAMTVGGLLILTLGLGSLSTGITQERSYTTTIESATGQQVIEQHFPAGLVAPTTVIAPASTTKPVLAAAQATAGVQQAVMTARAGNIVSLTVTLKDPPDGAAARATVTRLRSRLRAVTPGALVGGNTAVDLDTRTAAVHDRTLVIPLVLLLLLVVLGLLLRSVVAPIVLIGTVVLSFLAALGAAAFAFKHVFGYAGADPALPLFGFIFLVALGIDYNIFLMTRVREEAFVVGPADGVTRGLAITGGVITSAGVVLAATFSILVTLPLVQLAEVGFLVAFGVLADTFVVRSLLVPALALDIGPRMWWPSRLSVVGRGRHRVARVPLPAGPYPNGGHPNGRHPNGAQPGRARSGGHRASHRA